MPAARPAESAAQALYAGLAQRLAVSIRQGALRRGERMPSVREVSRTEGLSMSTVLQAYRVLEDSRLVEARPRSGYFVIHRPAGLPEPQTTALPGGSVEVGIAAISEAVMRLAHDPACISFGAACPAMELFGEERIGRAVRHASQRHRSAVTRYPLGAGEEALRRAIARQAMGLGCELDPERLLITNGCQAAISLCLRAVTRPGDIVALESPTSFGFLELLESMQLRALEIPTSPRQGLSLEALQLALETQPVKAILTVPTLSNPLGACLPLAHKRRLAELAARHDVPVIEDVVYNELAAHDDKRRAVKAFDTTGHVMLCGSFTKTVAPGIRLGWVEGGRWRGELQRLKAVHSGGQSPLLELALAELLARPGHAMGLRRLREAFAERVDQAREVIAASFPKGTRVTTRRAASSSGSSCRARSTPCASSRPACANASASRPAPCSAPPTAIDIASGSAWAAPWGRRRCRPWGGWGRWLDRCWPRLRPRPRRRAKSRRWPLPARSRTRPSRRTSAWDRRAGTKDRGPGRPSPERKTARENPGRKGTWNRSSRGTEETSFLPAAWPPAPSST